MGLPFRWLCTAGQGVGENYLDQSLDFLRTEAEMNCEGEGCSLRGTRDLTQN